MKVRSISLVTLCLCLLGPVVHAQTTKGSFLLGGSVGFSGGKSKYTYSSSTFNYESHDGKSSFSFSVGVQMYFARKV